MRIWFLILMFVVGAAMGSFCCCQAWRVRYRSLGKKSLGKWSVCLNCGHRLTWYENIPVISWIMLRGRCGKCGEKIGIAEILAEVLTGIAFVVMSMGFNLEKMAVMEWLIMGLTLAFVTILSFLAIYDGKWGELPLFGLVALGVCGLMICGVEQIGLAESGEWTYLNLVDVAGAVMILFGVYYILYKLSKGKWVGDGDMYLGLGVALALSNAWLAIWVMFVANFLGCVVMAPLKKKKVYFGPFIAIAYVIVLGLGNFLINLL